MLSSGPVVCAAAAGAGWGGGREAWRDLGPQWGGKEGALQMKRGRREGEKMRTVHSEPRGTPDMAQVALGVKILLPPVTARGSAQAVTRWPRNGLPAPPPSPPQRITAGTDRTVLEGPLPSLTVTLFPKPDRTADLLSDLGQATQPLGAMGSLLESKVSDGCLL